MNLKDLSIKPRWYQNEASDSAISVIRHKDRHPILAIPTGAGKTLIICLIIMKYLKDNPDKNILVVSHVKEILEQNFNSLKKNLDSEIGLFSAGLNSKIVKQVTVVSIQTGINSIDQFKDISLIIIDECHRISENDEGIYRRFLSSFDCNYIGLSATPFRMRGYIHLSEEALFTEISYDLTTTEKFNRLVKEGYLAKLYSKGTDLKMTIPKGVATVGGDWANNDLDMLFNNDRVTVKALEEASKIINSGKYKKILIFCINISHSERTSEILNRLGQSCTFIHSKMDGNRDNELKSFREGKVKCLANVDMATTGLDIPDIDMIIMLRPTKSISLYVQMVGRGLRVYPNKNHCLVLDFAENVSNMGPINDLRIDQKGKAIKGGDAPTKECPECGCLNHPIVKNCIACNYEFKFKIKITEKSSELSIIKKEKPQTLTVSKVTYNRHKKKNKPDSLRIDFQVGLRKYHKWLAIESNYAYLAAMAVKEIPEMLKKNETFEGKIAISTILKQVHKFKKPKTILVDVNEKFPEIINIDYEEDL